MTAHISGQYTAPPQFTHENYWQPLKIFLGHVDSMSEQCWGRILSLDPTDGEEVDEDFRADRSMISAYQVDIYVPTSPVKA